MFKWLTDFLGISSKPEPTREEIIVAAAPIAPTPVVTGVAVDKVEEKPAAGPAAVAKSPAKKATAAKAKAPAKKAAAKKSKS